MSLDFIERRDIWQWFWRTLSIPKYFFQIIEADSLFGPVDFDDKLTNGQSDKQAEEELEEDSGWTDTSKIKLMQTWANGGSVLFQCIGIKFFIVFLNYDSKRRKI